MAALADAVREAGEIDTGAGWDELQSQIVATGESAATSYGAVAAVAPVGLADELSMLIDYNLELSDAAGRAESLAAFQAAVVAPSTDVLSATETIDEYMRDTCSVGLTSR